MLLILYMRRSELKGIITDALVFVLKNLRTLKLAIKFTNFYNVVKPFTIALELLRLIERLMVRLLIVVWPD